MRSDVVFMGTPSFSVPFLDSLLKSVRKVSCVITQPDKPKGRGRKFAPSAVKEFAVQHNIPILQPKRLSEPSLIDSIKVIRPAYIVVVAYGKLIPPEILRLPEKGCINVHASLLPEYRGASPIQWAIIHGRSHTGITTIMMSEELDAGDILLRKKIEVAGNDTAETLSLRLSEIGVDLLNSTLEGLDRGEIVPQPQEHARASYAPLLKKENGLIDWKDTSENIYNRIRGFTPWPGAYTFLKGKRWGIWRSEVLEKQFSPSVPGEIVKIQEGGIVITTGDTALKIIEIQVEGKKRMGVDEYLRGHKVEKGTIFGSS